MVGAKFVVFVQIDEVEMAVCKMVQVMPTQRAFKPANLLKRLHSLCSLLLLEVIQHA